LVGPAFTNPFGPSSARFLKLAGALRFWEQPQFRIQSALFAASVEPIGHYHKRASALLFLVGVCSIGLMAV